MDQHTKLFVISVAAKLTDMHPQTLRQYDRLGLVVPERTMGHSRRYSMRDIVQLREIQRLSQAGVSLEGIRRILELENEVERLQHKVEDLQDALDEALDMLPGARRFTAGAGGEVVSVLQGRHRARPDDSAALVVWRPF